MVFDLAHRRGCFRRAKSAGLALILLLAAGQACADTFDDIAGNTVGLRVTRDGQEISRGVGLFLGFYEGKALLLTPAHVVPNIGEIGKPGSRYRFEIRIARVLETYEYSQSAVQLKRTPIEDAVRDDYLIIKLPVGEAKRRLITNLTGEHLRRPDRNRWVFIFSPRPTGGYGTNWGEMESISGGDVVKFDIKAEKIIEQGESGSPIIGLLESRPGESKPAESRPGESRAVNGILVSSGGPVGTGVYPTNELDSALQTIGRAKANPENLHGFSLAAVPTYQYVSKAQDLGGGNTHTETQHGFYTSLELEYFRLTRDPDEDGATKLGLIAGYSGGKAHALGQIDDAEYTIKYGLVAGGVNRAKNDTGQFALFVLSHRENGKFVHRVGVSMEAVTQVSARDHYAFDVGARMEINKLSTQGGSIGLGLVLRYSWLRAL